MSRSSIVSWHAVNRLVSEVTEEAGINTIERMMAMGLAFRIRRDIKSGNEQETDKRRMRLITREERIRKRVVLANKRRGKCNLGKEIQIQGCGM
jgi:hypothetical protein